MKTLIRIALLMSASATLCAADKPLPNQQATNQVVPIALAVPASGTVAATDAFTPRALLVNPTTGALKVESTSGSGASSSQVQGAAADGTAVTGNPILQGGTDGTNVQSITTDTSGNQIVVGNVAAAATDSGNPIKMGGVYSTTNPTLTNGQRGNLQLGPRGILQVQLSNNGSVLPTITTAQAAVAASNSTGLYVVNFPYTFDGTNWNVAQGNTSAVILASAARTTTQTGADIINYNSRALHVVLNVTANTSAAGITVAIEGKDANNIYYTLLTGTAITGTGTSVYKIGPGITPVANGASSDFIPRTFRVVVTAGDASSVTYSLAYNLIN